MPLVTMPDGQQVNLPDNPTEEQKVQIRSLMQRQPEAPPAPEQQASPENWLAQSRALIDQLKTEREVAPGTQRKEYDSRIKDLETQVKSLELDQLRKNADNGEFMDKAKYYLTVGGDAAMRGLAALPAAAVDAGVAASYADAGMKLKPDDPMFMNMTQRAAGIGHLPKTPGEKFASGAIEGAVSGMTAPGVGTLGGKAVIGATSGLGGEAGAQLFGDSAITRLTGAILGGLIPAGVAGSVKNSGRLVREATGGMNAQDWVKAKGLEKTLTDANIPHLKSQLLGPASTLDDLVERASGVQGTRAKLLRHLTHVPERARKAVNVWQDQAQGPGIGSTREVLGDVQEEAAARGAALKAKSNQLYGDKLPDNVKYSPQEARDIAAKLRTAGRDPNYFAKGGPGESYLDDIANRVEQQIEESAILGPTGKKIYHDVDGRLINNLLKEANMRATTTEGMQMGLQGKPLREAKSILAANTPEFEAARAAKIAAYDKLVQPFEKGLAGDLKRMGGGVKADRYTANEQAFRIVFPADKTQPQEIRQLIKDIGLEPVNALYRESLTRAMNRVFKETKIDPASGVKQPAKLVDEVIKTEAQRRNTAELLNHLAAQNGADPRQVKQGFYRLMKALDTFHDVKISGRLDPVATEQKAGANLAAKSVALMSRISRAIELRTAEKAYREIADAVMSPTGMRELEEIAKRPDTQYAMTYLLSTLTAANREGDNTEQPQEK